MIPAFHSYSETVRWDDTTGLSPQQLEQQYRMLDAQPAASYAVTKTRLIRFMLGNARLADQPDDIFPCLLDHNELAFKVRWEHRAKVGADQMKEALAKAAAHTKEDAIWPDTDFGHIAPDWAFVLTNGIPGIIRILRECLAKAAPDRVEFFRCSLECWEGIGDFVRRLIAHTPCAFAADNLRELLEHPPETLAQAMQLTLLVYNIQTNVETTNIRSLGRLDTLYRPFFEADLRSGRFTEDELRLLFRHFFSKCSSFHTAANLPIAIGGIGADGGDLTNDLTLLMLEEYDRLDIYDPKFHVLYHPGFRADVLDRLLSMIRRGRSSFVFINCETVEQALINIGDSPEDARDFNVYGCYETAAAGKELPTTCGGQVNLPKAVAYTLEQDYDSFPAFYAALQDNVRMLLTEAMDTITAWEQYYDQICPAPILSATFASCREKGLDIFRGGAKYNNTSVIASCVASLVDMAAAVKHAVFDEKRCTLAQLKEALAANWDGYEEQRRYCADSCPKYGNGDPEADALTAALCHLAADTVNGYPNGRGGVFRCGMFSIDYRFAFGRALGATPDGRFAKEPLSKNFCACQGQDRNGVTALVLSASRIDGTRLPDGAVLDLVLHPSAVSGEEGLTVMKGLMSAYFLNKGFAIQFNVLDADILRKAQQEPERYRNLQVRLCGWNVYFVNLSKQEQDEFIRQAEMV